MAIKEDGMTFSFIRSTLKNSGDVKARAVILYES